MKFLRLVLASLGFALFASKMFAVYDPQVGRWTSRDPIGEDGGLNLYAYVENNPINRIDPFGLAYVATRPLISWQAQFGAFATGKDPYHATIFFEDGKSPHNLSYGNDGIREESAAKGPMYGDRWPVSPAKFDDATMREAIDNLNKSGDWTADKYNKDHTCQEFAEAAFREYQRLMKEKQKKNDCNK